MKTQIAAIDFGTSKIVTIVAQSGGISRLDIIGSGTVPYAGFSGGDWNEPDVLTDAVRDSVAAAELEANAKIREVYVGVPGDYVHVATGEAEIELTGPITEDEINRVQDLVADKLRVVEKGGYVLHRSPAWFSIDDGKKTMEPMGGTGARLRARVSFMIADPVFVDDAAELMGMLGITVLGFLSPMLGECLLFLSLEDRDRIAMIVDVGYLTTEVAVVEGDAVVYHAMLGSGGGFMTAALAEGIKLPMHMAEQVKRAYLFNPDEFDQDNFYSAYDNDGRRVDVQRVSVSRNMDEAMDELCDLIDKTLKNDAAQYFGPRSQIYLTGGGIALMRGGREYLAARVGRPVKVPAQKTAKLNSPVYASALGLVSLVFDSIEQQDTGEQGLGKKIAGLFKRG